MLAGGSQPRMKLLFSTAATDDGLGTHVDSSRSVSPRVRRSARTSNSVLSRTPSVLRPNSRPVTVQPCAQSRTLALPLTGVPSSGTCSCTVTEPEALFVET